MAGVKKQNGNKKINKQENLEQYIELVIDEHKLALRGDDESKLDDIDIKLSDLNITFNQLIELPVNLMVVFFNHNESMCQCFPREKSTRTKLFNRLQSVVLKDNFDKEEFIIFLMWSGEIWKDKEFAVLVEKFCNSLTLDNRALLAKFRNLVSDFVHCEETLKVLATACERLRIATPYEHRVKTNQIDVFDEYEFFEEEMNKI